MIELQRRDAIRFRTTLRRCVVSRPRNLAPALVLHQGPEGLVLYAVLEETALALRLPGMNLPVERLLVPFTTLAALDVPGGGVVSFATSENGTVCCRWQERDQMREVNCAPVSPEAEPAPLPTGHQFHAVDPSFLAALHACGQTTSREAPAHRFDTARLQLRGQAGEVAGTDGRQLLLWGGFVLPFQENLLVPAVPVFGSRELAGPEVHIARTEKHVAVTAGPWTVWLAIDRAGRFPDVTAVMPRCTRMSRLAIDDLDAAALLQELPKEPASDDDETSVVLSLGPRPAVRWPEETSSGRGPVNLVHSACTGAATVARLNPMFLLRALSLGFREVRCSAGEAPILFRDEKRSYLVASQSPAAVVQRPALPAPAAAPLPQPGEEPMNPDRNGTPPSEIPPVDDVLDPVVEAEALRTALAEVARRVSRLIASLRQFQKQRRALHTAWTSLQHLGLGHREKP